MDRSVAAKLTFEEADDHVTFYNDITLVPNTFYTVNSLGLGQLHQGVELETRIRPTSFLKLRGMVSYGDWKYKGNATYDIVDQTTLQAMNSKSYTIHYTKPPRSNRMVFGANCIGTPFYPFMALSLKE